MLLNSGDQLENWRILSLLGEGGMGSVYRGQSLMLDDIQAAIKVTRPSDFHHARERFGREIKALLKLHHPAVVRVQGFGEDQERGLLWFAMDMVDGEPLDEFIARGAMPLDSALPFFVSLADGLAHAHERGVAHRDLKPANVIVRRDGSPVLVDFGISMTAGDHQLTKTGGVIGTPQYMPPEALDGRLEDPMLGDIYALGQVLLETITGRPAFPFDAKLTSTQNALRIMHNKVQVGPLDPGSGVPDALRAVVVRATHPEPSVRTASCAAVAEQLRAVASGTAASWGGPTLAPPRTGETWAPSAPTAAAPATVGTSATMELEPAPAPRKRRGWVVGGLLAVVLIGLLGIGLTAIAGGAAWWLASRGTASDAVASAAPGEASGAAPNPLHRGSPEDPGNPLGRPDPVPTGAGTAAPSPLDRGTTGTAAAAGTPAPAGQPGPSPLTPRPGTAAADLGPPDGDIVDDLVDDRVPTAASTPAVVATAPPATTAPGVVAPAVVAPKPAAAPATKAMRPNWGSMAGVSKGTSDSDLERLFGDYSSTSSPYCRTGESARSYLDNSVIVCRRIVGGARRVQVTRRALAFRSKLPDDPKLSLLGMTGDQLEAAIGAPAGRDGSGRWRYEYNTVIFDFAGGTVRSVVIDL